MEHFRTLPKDVRAASPVVATILLVAITIALAATIYVMMSAFVGPTQYGPQYIGVVVEMRGGNWTLTIVSVPTGLLPKSTYVLIRDANLNLLLEKLPLSALTRTNWATYHVLYDGSNPTVEEIAAGDRIDIDRSWYAAPSIIEISDASRILTTQRLG